MRAEKRRLDVLPWSGREIPFRTPGKKDKPFQ
jgi:hypothetical protein